MKVRCQIAISLVIFFATSLIPLHVLQIKAIREKRTVYARIIHSDESFATKYIHSVELCAVWEYFKIDKKHRIILYETTFSSCNTGLPYTNFNEETFHNDGTCFRISNMQRILPSLNLWVNETYDNTLVIGNTEKIKLSTLAGNTLLRLAIKRVTLAEFAFMKLQSLFN